jgi:hypothetical protein
LDNQYRWEALDTPVQLTAGSTYVLGAADPGHLPGSAAPFDPLLLRAPIDPNFTALGRAYDTPTASSYGLVFPNTYTAFNPNDPTEGWFGPNLQAVTTIPEPSAMVLCSVVAATFISWKRRQVVERKP